MNLSDIAKLIEQSINGQEVTEAYVMSAMQAYLEENDPETYRYPVPVGMYSVMRRVDDHEFSREEAAEILTWFEADENYENEVNALIPQYVEDKIKRLQEKDGRNRTAYTEDELIPLTYAVLFGEEDFGGRSAIVSSMERSEESLVFKMRQIASILDHRGIERNQAIEAIENIGYEVTTGKDWGDPYSSRWDIYDLAERIGNIFEYSKDEMREKALGVLCPDKGG